MLEISRLKALEKIIEEEKRNEYIRGKKDIVKNAIYEILKNQKDSTHIKLPQKIGFENFLQILLFFFGEKSINELNGYGIYFVINFLMCCNDTKFEDKSLQEVKDTLSKENLEKLIGDGEEWEKKKSRQDLIQLGLGEQLEKYDL